MKWHEICNELLKLWYFDTVTKSVLWTKVTKFFIITSLAAYSFVYNINNLSSKQPKPKQSTSLNVIYEQFSRFKVKTIFKFASFIEAWDLIFNCKSNRCSHFIQKKSRRLEEFIMNHRRYFASSNSFAQVQFLSSEISSLKSHLSNRIKKFHRSLLCFSIRQTRRNLSSFFW